MNSADSNTGTLYLIPVTLGKTPTNNTIPEHVLEIIRKLDVLIVEQVKTASRFLQWVGDTIPEYEIEFLQLNEDTKPEELQDFLQPLQEGRDVGLMSEAGTPVVADPGSSIIRLAHTHDIPVVPLTGPSSITLALMASGYNGQNFAFTGYLPIEADQRRSELQSLEKESRQKGRTILFMETPHRNNRLLKTVIETCRPNTHFCIAVNLTLPNEFIQSQTIREWRAADSLPDLDDQPTIFLMHAGNLSQLT